MTVLIDRDKQAEGVDVPVIHDLRELAGLIGRL
jgi:hypothetical protein